jgi:hypothetical protein
MAVWWLLLTAAAATACPFHTPCNCSPGTGIAKFRGVCETVNGVDTTPCVDAVVQALARANVTAQWLERHRTPFDEFFMWCDADAASSCVTAPYPAPGGRTMRGELCTGRRRLSWGSVVCLCIFLIPLVLLAVLACYELCGVSCGRGRERPWPQHLHAAEPLLQPA